MIDTVTNRDLRDALNELKIEVSKVLDDHETRLREGERFRNRIYGVMILFATLPSLVVNFIWNELTRR